VLCKRIRKQENIEQNITPARYVNDSENKGDEDKNRAVKNAS